MADTRQLFVLRHAKSSWEDPGLEDRDRPLAPRGRRAVKLLAEHVKGNGIAPALVLCSPARRTRETLEGVEPGGEVLIEPELYDANAEELVERLRRIEHGIQSVMVVGHNPAMQVLVLRLAGHDTAAGADLEAVRAKFPTGALATLAFGTPWSELSPRVAELTALARPRDLH